MMTGYYKDYKIVVRGTQMLAVHGNGMDALVGDRKAVAHEIDTRYNKFGGSNSSDLTKIMFHTEMKKLLV